MNSLVRLIDAGLSGTSRILALGAGVSALAVALSNRGHEVVESRAGDGHGKRGGIDPHETFDVVVAVGYVEHLRWDRWALQQIHHLLRDGGLLLLVVPDLYSLRSLADPRYVASKLAKLLRRPARTAPTAPAREAFRSYPAGRLRATLEGLGYEPLRWSGIGLQSGQGLAGGRTWPPTHHVVLARKRSAAAATQAEPAAIRRFEQENRTFLQARERWRRKLPGNGPPRALEPGRYAGARVLVLAPHPDDEIIGCGGTLLQLVRAGAKVTVIQATDGSASAALEGTPPAIRRTIRLEEAHAVAEAAGFEPTIFWREDNGAFQARDDLVDRLRNTLREIAPALIFSPFVADIHADHRTLNRILAQALAGLPDAGTSILGYEVWSLAPANLFCDVTSSMRDVERLLLLYQTAMKVDDFIHMCGDRNRAHAQALVGAPGYAEAFFATDPERFRDLVARTPER